MKEQLEQIKTQCRAVIELSESATRGPWQAVDAESDDPECQAECRAIWTPEGQLDGDNNTDDVLFIVHSHDICPKAARVVLAAIAQAEHGTGSLWPTEVQAYCEGILRRIVCQWHSALCLVNSNLEGIPPTDAERAANYRKVNELAAEGKLKLMTPKPTDLELQLFLAKELEGKVIRIVENYTDGEPGINMHSFWWSDSNDRVTPREWEHVVRKVEEKLTRGKQLDRYYDHLVTLCGQGWTIQDVAMSSWQTRAIALRKVMGKEEV